MGDGDQPLDITAGGSKIKIDEIKKMTYSYCGRMHAIKDGKAPELDLQSEYLIHYIDIDLVRELAAIPNCKMLLAMQGVEIDASGNDKKFTTILVPADSKGKALSSDENNDIEGLERFPPPPPVDQSLTMESILTRPGGYKIAVDEILSRHGII